MHELTIIVGKWRTHSDTLQSELVTGPHADLDILTKCFWKIAREFFKITLATFDVAQQNFRKTKKMFFYQCIFETTMDLCSLISWPLVLWEALRNDLKGDGKQPFLIPALQTSPKKVWKSRETELTLVLFLDYYHETI